MRVLMLPSFYGYPGKEHIGVFFKNQALAIKKVGIQVDVLYVESRTLRDLSIGSLNESHFQIVEAIEDGILTIRQKGWNTAVSTSIGGYCWSVLTIRLVGYYIKRYGCPDLIHAHNIFWAGYAAVCISKKYQVPYIVTEHSSAFLLGEIPKKLFGTVTSVCRRASKVIAVSKSLANAVNANLKYSDVEIEVVPNVIDTEYFTLPSTEPYSKPYIFLAVANLNKNKGLHILIRAFEKAFRNQSDVLLHIGGDGPEREELIALVVNLGIIDQVHFLGYLKRSQVRDAMWRAHVFVLSSFKETFGVVLIEALATGLPIVTTRSGGPEDIVTKETGLLVSPGDVKDLSFALTRMHDKIINLRSELRSYAVNNYSQKYVGNKIAEIYRSIL
jgi:glycosyltransferase involved in cell wall biosynthesis